MGCSVCGVRLVIDELVGTEVSEQVEYVCIGGGVPRALEHVEWVCVRLLCMGSPFYR